jgi:hypothetical protein
LNELASTAIIATTPMLNAENMLLNIDIHLFEVMLFDAAFMY